jgi:hypothetical protein
MQTSFIKIFLSKILIKLFSLRPLRLCGEIVFGYWFRGNQQIKQRMPSIQMR